MAGPRPFDVQGTVTFAEKAVPNGWVIFLSNEQKRNTAEISAEGRYQTELPAGEYQVGVAAPRLSDKTGMDAFDEPVLPPHVPVRYSDPKYSGLRVTVEPKNENTVDLSLKDVRRRKRRR